MKLEHWCGSLVWSGGLLHPLIDQIGKTPFPTTGIRLKSIFGVVPQPSKGLAEWLSGLLQQHVACKIRMIASVFPACATTSADLEEFAVLEGSNFDQMRIRVFPEKSLLIRGTSLVCVIDSDDRARMVVGSCDNLGIFDLSPTQIQVSTPVPPDLVDLLCKEFDQLWNQSGNLTEELIQQYPKLVLPEGSREATNLWISFWEACQPMDASPNPINPGQKGGDSQGDLEPSPTSAIGVKRMNSIERHLVDLFRQGHISILDESTRLKPVDVPLKPEWFDVDRTFAAGAIKSKTSFRISPFHADEFKDLEANRRAVADLLSAHSFSLGSRVRWMPDRVRPMFEESMKRLGKKWKDDAREIIGDDLDSFLTGRRSKIHTDAQSAYEKFHPGMQMPSGSLLKIELEIEKRLHGLISSAFDPGVSYSALQYELADQDGKGGSCAQAASLLLDMARFQREAILKASSWMQRTSASLDRKALVERQDLLDDQIRCLNSMNDLGRSRAERQMRILDELDEFSGRDLQLCTSIFEIVKGCSIERFDDRVELEKRFPTLTQAEEDRLPF